MFVRFGPACAVAVVTMGGKVLRELVLCWGIVPYLTEEVASTDRIFSLSAETALKEGLVQDGDTIVITAGVPLGRTVSTNLIKAHIIGKDNM